MSMYQMVFADGEHGLPLLGALGFKSVGAVGRYRSSWIEKDEDGKPRIAIYTRNGGGNRECSHDNPKYGNERCNHHVVTEEVDEYLELTEEEIKAKGYKPANIFVGSKRGCYTGKKVMEDFYYCDKPDSAECGCYGCFISYRAEKHPNYLFDQDDDFDCTYATIYFSIPDNLKQLLDKECPDWEKGLQDKVDMSERWQKAIDSLKAAS